MGTGKARVILLRSALYNFYFWTITAVMAVGSLPIRFFFPEAALAYGKIWVRAVLAGLAPLAGIRIAVTGREHLPAGGPALIASQHQSAFDTLVWLTLVPRPAYVVKRELLRLPLFGPMIRPAGQIPIDRAGGAAAIRSLLAASASALAADRQIVIFPEGTRVAPGAVGRLQPGIAALAAHTGLPVIPVATDSGRLWGRRGFRKRPGTIHIAIHPKLPPRLSRQALLAHLAALYQAGPEAAAPAPAALVENSVESLPPGLPDR
jgi:1-acyl-sn-glycerol-3-phosphate acyltransferase